MAPLTRLFSTSCRLASEGGLTRSGTPPSLPRRRERGLPTKTRIPDVSKVVAVSSAKGGVGKSTVAVNIALSAARRGLRAGILDADVFGPSVPALLNLSGEPRLSAENKLVPLSNYGVKSMSMGYLVGKDAPIVWRGLMVMKALQDLLHNVAWGGLDVLVVDLPPGTGDVQLTLTQQVELDGAVVVSTPQSLALVDSVRGINMFRKVGVPLLGVVQNMALYRCSKCGNEEHVFGHDGVRGVCEEWEVPFLGDVPLHPQINIDADAGRPTVVADPDGPNARALEAIAGQVFTKLGLDV